MNCVVLPLLHNVLHSGACWCCYTILLLHITTHCYHCITTCYHCYTIVALLSTTQKVGNTNNITNFNIKQPWPKQRKQQGNDGKLVHLKKNDKGQQEGDVLLLKHFTQVREIHKQSKLLSLQQATIMLGSALHTTSENSQRTRS
jgi:hypothetical protein